MKWNPQYLTTLNWQLWDNRLVVYRDVKSESIVAHLTNSFVFEKYIASGIYVNVLFVSMFCTTQRDKAISHSCLCVSILFPSDLCVKGKKIILQSFWANRLTSLFAKSKENEWEITQLCPPEMKNVSYFISVHCQFAFFVWTLCSICKQPILRWIRGHCHTMWTSP